MTTLDAPLGCLWLGGQPAASWSVRMNLVSLVLALRLGLACHVHRFCLPDTFSFKPAPHRSEASRFLPPTEECVGLAWVNPAFAGRRQVGACCLWAPHGACSCQTTSGSPPATVYDALPLFPLDPFGLSGFSGRSVVARREIIGGLGRVVKLLFYVFTGVEAGVAIALVIFLSNVSGLSRRITIVTHVIRPVIAPRACGCRGPFRAVAPAPRVGMSRA